MTLGAVILTGGKSSRMGTDKANLLFEGQKFSDRIIKELSDFDELLISVSKEENRKDFCGTKVIDIYPQCGPMSGLHAALTKCKSEALLAVPCDLPLYKKDLGDMLISHMSEELDVIVPVTSDGRKHPLCSVYKKKCKDTFEESLKKGEYKLMLALNKLNVLYVPIKDDRYEKMLTNVNTMEEYKSLCREDFRQ